MEKSCSAAEAAREINKTEEGSDKQTAWQWFQTNFCEVIHGKEEELLHSLLTVTEGKGVQFQQDNAQPHTSHQTKKKFKSLDGIVLLLHPPFGQDLFQSDFYFLNP